MVHEVWREGEKVWGMGSGEKGFGGEPEERDNGVSR